MTHLSSYQRAKTKAMTVFICLTVPLVSLLAVFIIQDIGPTRALMQAFFTAISAPFVFFGNGLRNIYFALEAFAISAVTLILPWIVATAAPIATAAVLYVTHKAVGSFKTSAFGCALMGAISLVTAMYVTQSYIFLPMIFVFAAFIFFCMRSSEPYENITAESFGLFLFVIGVGCVVFVLQRNHAYQHNSTYPEVSYTLDMTPAEIAAMDEKFSQLYQQKGLLNDLKDFDLYEFYLKNKERQSIDTNTITFYAHKNGARDVNTFHQCTAIENGFSTRFKGVEKNNVSQLLLNRACVLTYDLYKLD